MSHKYNFLKGFVSATLFILPSLGMAAAEPTVTDVATTSIRKPAATTSEVPTTSGTPDKPYANGPAKPYTGSKPEYTSSHKPMAPMKPATSKPNAGPEKPTATSPYRPNTGPMKPTTSTGGSRPEYTGSYKPNMGPMKPTTSATTSTGGPKPVVTTTTSKPNAGPAKPTTSATTSKPNTGPMKPTTSSTGKPDPLSSMRKELNQKMAEFSAAERFVAEKTKMEKAAHTNYENLKRNLEVDLKKSHADVEKMVNDKIAKAKAAAEKAGLDKENAVKHSDKLKASLDEIKKRMESEIMKGSTKAS